MEASSRMIISLGSTHRSSSRCSHLLSWMSKLASVLVLNARFPVQHILSRSAGRSPSQGKASGLCELTKAVEHHRFACACIALDPSDAVSIGVPEIQWHDADSRYKKHLPAPSLAYLL